MDVRMYFDETPQEILSHMPLRDEVILKLECGLMLQGKIVKREPGICWIESDCADHLVRLDDVTGCLKVLH